MAKTKYSCVFCGKGTNFQDNKKAFCIDCYCKLRNSAHTHDIINQPIRINPLPLTKGIGQPPYKLGVAIC